MKRRLFLLSVIAALLICCAALPYLALADVGDPLPIVPDLYEPGPDTEYLSSFDGWHYENGTLTLTADPVYYGDIAPISDQRPWASVKDDIECVVIGEDVTLLGAKALADCSNLEQVVISGELTAVGNYAFQNCVSLSSISLPSTVYVIGTHAFSGCSALSTIALPALWRVGEYAFEYCSGLQGVTFADTAGRSVTFGNGVFQGCTSLTSIALPDTDILSVAMFRDCTALQSVTLLFESGYDGISVADFAFEGCSALTTIYPQNIEYMGNSSFKNCTSLSEISFTADYKVYLSANAFAGCTALSTVRFNNVEPASINATAFTGVTADVHYPAYKAWQNFDKQDFGGDLTWVSEAISDQILSGTLGNISWTLSLADGLLTVRGQGDITYEGDDRWVFYEDSIVKAVFENGVTNVPAGAFEGCTNLEEVVLPSSVTNIGSYAFDRCTSLTGVTIPDGMINIGTWTFRRCTSLTSIRIPETIRRIGDGAFRECSALQEIIIPNSVLYISDDAFNGCSGASTITIGNSVQHIGAYAFANCKPQSLTIPASVTYMEGEGELAGAQTVYFLGDLPEFGSTSLNPFGTITGAPFDHVDPDYIGEVNVYYPVGNTSWASMAQNDFSGERGYVVWHQNTGKIDLSRCDMTLSETAFTYDGTAHTPSVLVKLSDKTLILNTDYTLAYADNINAGTAIVTVTGKRDYTGTRELTYTIAKAEPTLSFAAGSLNMYTDEPPFTNPLTYTTDGSIIYYTGDPAVATVDSVTGQVTIVGEGSTRITAYAVEGANYASGSAEFSLSVSKKAGTPLTWAKLRYSFRNSNKALGYPDPYYIPLERYRLFYSEAQAQMLYSQARQSGGWGGSCNGFSTTSVLFNNENSGLELSGYGVTKVSSLKPSTKSSRYGLTVVQLLEAMQVSWWTPTMGYKLIENDLNGLIAEVQNGSTAHTLPVIAIYGKSNGRTVGHAVVGYKVVKKNATTSYLYVYDCNYPDDDTRKITLTTDSNGNYTGWSYSINNTIKCGTNYAGSYFGYETYQNIKATWNSRAGAAPNVNLLAVSSNTFDVYDYAGNKVASMDDGEFNSYRSSIYEYTAMDNIMFKDNIISLPPGVYTVTDKSGSSSLNATMVNREQTAEVRTDTDSVTFAVVDSSEFNQVYIPTDEGDSYYVKLSSDLPCAVGMEVIEFSGTGTDGATISVGTASGEINLTNCSGVTMLINDNMVATSVPEYQRSISAYPMQLEFTQAVYTGDAIEPAVIVGEGYNLVQGTDFVVTYSNNRQPGTATANVYGIGNYTGNTALQFTIVATASELCAGGHTWDEGHITREATFAEDGEIEYTCAVCGTKLTQPYSGLEWKLTSSGLNRTVRLTNKTGAQLQGKLCITGYDASGKVTVVKVRSVSLAKSEYTQVALTLTNDTVAIKAMVLEDDTFSPICPVWTAQ